VKVLVCLKQVPDTEANIRIDSNSKGIDESGIKFVVNPYDEFAIEEGLKLKEAGLASSVIAIALGPDRAKEALKTAVAMGVDDVVLLKTENSLADGLVTAKVLAIKIKDLGADLVLMGKEAIDDGNMQVGPMLSELLNFPCITVVTKLDVADNIVKAEREIEGGTEVLQTSTPCIITCQKGLNEPRFPSIRGVMMAKKKQVEEEPVTLENAKAVISELSYPPARGDSKIVGEGVDAVPELVRLLREEAKVI
jgi:electron transfer flavoprotein beta subunit